MEQKKSGEHSRESRMEQVREFMDDLRRFHDFFEDRSIMADPEIAEFVASQFTTAGIEVFSDFAEHLRKAKKKDEKSTEE